MIVSYHASLKNRCSSTHISLSFFVLFHVVSVWIHSITAIDRLEGLSSYLSVRSSIEPQTNKHPFVDSFVSFLLSLSLSIYHHLSRFKCNGSIIRTASLEQTEIQKRKSNENGLNDQCIHTGVQ